MQDDSNKGENEIIDLGNEIASDSKETTSEPPIRFKFEKKEVHPYDIFKLAKGILIACAIFFMSFALIRIFYNDPNGYDKSGIREVWDFSKVMLNSIVSLVLGLYFGSKQDQK